MGACHCNQKQNEIGSIEIDNAIVAQKQELSNPYLNEKLYSNPFLLQSQAAFRGYLSRSLFQKKASKEAEEELEIKFNFEELNEVPKIISQSAAETLKNLVNFTYKDKAIGVINRGPVKLQDHSIYVGEWNKSGTPCGRGERYLSDGSYSKGIWKDGKMHGHCLQVFANGDYYVGDVFEDTIQGLGKLFTIETQCSYEGEWKNGKQNGFGVENWPDGARFSGNFVNGKKNGKGKFIWADGSMFDGDFLDNQITGYGKYNWADDRSYEGRWLNNMMSGTGIFLWPDGRKYEGEYVNDKKEGKGVFTWPNNKVYEGTWKNGKQHGIGEIRALGKKTKKGEWKDGKRIRWIA
ncbi:unnamed protein product [Blepharisma stoltei]|uniref:MORN repeat protein n=1 Tax=Blepharisma stoltei TaxID=1481888 RepID=A0AAU9ITK0_9CILI|nr:unnamed protein product [Blepharisma stoltei]